MVTYGYLRVSTEKQNLENNRGKILDYANTNNLGKVEWIVETISGRKLLKNRILGLYLDTKFQKGDTVIMSEYSRISRDMMDGLNFVAACRKKEVTLVSLANDIPLKDTANDNLILCMTAWKAQLEREAISTRTKTALQRLKSEGVHLGNKGWTKLKTDKINEIQDAIKGGIKKKAICKKYGVTYATLRSFLKKNHITI